MPPEVTCPVCQQRTPGPNTPEGACACPRCGAALSRTEVRPPSGDIQTRRPVPAALPTLPCPSCGKAVPELCLLCPHCEGPVAERHRFRDDGAGEGRWGPQLLAPIVMLFVAVGATALLFLLFAGIVELATLGRAGIASAALLGLLLLGIGVPLLGRRLFRRGAQAGSPRPLTTQATVVGCLIATAVALFIFLFAVCSMM